MVLALYSLQIETKVSANSSLYGLGAVLMQRQSANSTWKPVAYASRALTETESRYAQVDKEALACTWAAENFFDYLQGKHFKMETDHKLLMSLLGNKNLDNLPPRILCFVSVCPDLCTLWNMFLGNHSIPRIRCPDILAYVATVLSCQMAKFPLTMWTVLSMEL